LYEIRLVIKRKGERREEEPSEEEYVGLDARSGGAGIKDAILAS
jgi:hypothetical protein